MWILIPFQDGGEVHYLIPGKEYVVGRKNCDILLSNDQSISRAHARLCISDQTIILKDSSKYGTFVKGQRVTADVNLMSGSVVVFGVFESKFRVTQQKLVVSSSCLDNDSKTSLSQALETLGGKLVNTWTQDCTHLVMPTVKVTIKTISALLCCCPIVKPNFFSEFCTAAQQKLPPPNCESFTPEIDEPSLSIEDVNIGIVSARKHIFAGKTFVFLNAKQWKRLGTAVGFGGGQSQLLAEGDLPCDLLQSPLTCVVDCTTASSQTQFPASLPGKGLRMITESEIGLASIYASCDKYCNPSCPTADLDSASKVKPKILSATLSHSVAVDETVLPGASQNITAYVVNTETTQRMEVCEMTGVAAVGETPEKKPIQQDEQICGSKPAAHTKTTQSVVPDTMRSSFIGSDSEVKLAYTERAGNSDIKPQPEASKQSSEVKLSHHTPSPQMPKTSAQTSPQKQSTLTSFFQPARKKRPLEDELSAVISEPKRSTPNRQPLYSLSMPKEASALIFKEPPAVFQPSPELTADLSGGRSVKATSKKRKEMEDFQMEDLELIMSQDMDLFDEQDSSHQTQQDEPMLHDVTEQKPAFNSSMNKKQRISREHPAVSHTESPFLPQRNPSPPNSEPHMTCTRTEQAQEPDGFQNSIKPEKSYASPTVRTKSLKDDGGMFPEENAEPQKADCGKDKVGSRAAGEIAVIKKEAQESKIDNDLPKKLVLVEFRSLTVSSPLRSQKKHIQANGHVKNFKCFRKSSAQGTGRFSQVIGGSDLLVHNRGKNTDVDEWLKDAVEEELQNRRDETAGDDLFRYNPTKLSKRR